jgi:uncharacterized protein YceK
MKKLLVCLLIGLLAEGCASVQNLREPSAQSGTVAVIHPTSQMTPTAVTKPLAVTAQPPVIRLGPGQGTPVSTALMLSPQGWLTFTSSAMGAAVDYPADWAVTEQGNTTIFSSPKGLMIQLQAAEGEGGGSQCTTLINASGLAAKVCVDAASGVYSATFKIALSDDSTKVLMLSTADLAAVEVYKAMINSMRPIH